MSGENVTLGMQFKVDGKDAVNTLKVSREELKQFRDEQAKGGDQTKQAAREEENLKRKTEEYVQSLTKKVATLGMGRQSLLQYEAAQLQLTEAEQKAVVSMQMSVDAHEKKEAAMERFVGVAGRAAMAAVAAGVAIAAMIKKESIAAAIEAAEAQVRLESTLKATQFAAGLTSKQLNQMADDMAKSTRFDDESIRAGIATMLKFKDVQGETFQEAIRLSADYAEATGTDFKSAAEAIGRALQDPDHAMRLMIATGGRFSETTRDQVKALNEQGRAAEAQTLILNRLKESVGGTATAMNTGLMKAAADTKKSWGELLEAIGKTDAVGGSFQRTATNITNFLDGIKGAVEGTDSTFLKFVGDVLANAPMLQQLGLMASQKAFEMDAKKNQPKAAPGLKDQLSGYLANDDAVMGKVRQDLIREAEAMDAADKKSREEKEKAAKAYQAVKKAAEDYLTTLKKESLSVGATTEQKIMLTAATHAMTLATEKERSEYLAKAAVMARATQEAEDELKAKKESEALTKKATDAQRAEVTQLEKAIETAKQHNYELLNGKGAYQEYEAAMLQATLTAYEANGATEEETATLRKKITALRELASTKAEGEAIAEAQKASEDFYRDLERQAKTYQGILTDAVERGLFEGGVKGGDLMKSLLRQVFRDIMSGNQNGIASSIMSMFGGGGGNGAGGVGAAATGSPMAMIAALSSMGGNLGAKALGAGDKGQQVGSIVGLLFGALPGAIVGKLTDPDGLAQRTAQFGTNPNGKYSMGGGITDAFGTFGTFNDKWFSDADMGAKMRDFFKMIANIDNKIAGTLTADQRAQVTANINKPKEYGFGTEHADFSGNLLEILRDRMATIVEAVLPGLGHLVTEFQGTGEELAAFAENLLGLKDGAKAIDAALATLSGDALPALKAQLTALDDAVTAAQTAMDTAITGKDPAAMLAAENDLQTAIVNRYQTEKQFIQQIGDELEQLKQSAYEFQVSIAQKMNAVGGSVDIAGMAAARGGDIRTSLAGITDPTKRIGAIQNYLSAIDTEYNARKAAILDEANNLQQQQQAAAAMQSAIAQARIAALQSELQMAGQWNTILSQSRQLIDQLRYTAASPLSAQARYGLAAGDSAGLFAQFQQSTGAQKISLANRLLPTLQQQAGLLGQSEQRPSDGYLAGYNQLQAMLSEVEQYSQTQADRAEALQQQLVSLQEESNSISQTAAIDTTGLLDELNAQYREQLQFAAEEGQAAYDLAEKQHEELLNQITGGMEIDLYLAQLQTDSRDALVAIKDTIAAFLTGAATTTTNNNTTNPGTGAGAGGGGGTGGGGNNTLDQKTISIELDGKVLGTAVVDIVNRNISSIAREAAFNSF